MGSSPNPTLGFSERRCCEVEFGEVERRWCDGTTGPDDRPPLGRAPTRAISVATLISSSPLISKRRRSAAFAPVGAPPSSPSSRAAATATHHHSTSLSRSSAGVARNERSVAASGVVQSLSRPKAVLERARARGKGRARRRRLAALPGGPQRRSISISIRSHRCFDATPTLAYACLRFSIYIALQSRSISSALRPLTGSPAARSLTCAATDGRCRAQSRCSHVYTRADPCGAARPHRASSVWSESETLPHTPHTGRRAARPARRGPRVPLRLACATETPPRGCCVVVLFRSALRSPAGCSPRVTPAA